MSFEQKRNIIVFLCYITITVYKFRVSGAPSLDMFNVRRDSVANQENSSENERGSTTKRHTNQKSEYMNGRFILSRNFRTTVDNSNQQTQNAELNKGVIAPTVSDMDALWNVRNAFSVHKKSVDLDSENIVGFKGFEGHSVQGKVYGPSVNHNGHSSEWLAMRPLVQCNDNLMTLTASGRGYIHLMVERVDASPISLFQVPPNCGYHLKTTWRDLVMMAPYDGCYVRQEKGNYVLHMLWWGSPVKFACPVLNPVQPQSAFSVLCSHFGLAVQIHKAEVMHRLRVQENGGWVPFVSQECAYQVESHPGDLIYFVPFTALCVTIKNGVHLPLQMDSQEFTFSCPRPPPLSIPPGDPHYHPIADHVISPPTTPSPPPSAQEQMPTRPAFFHFSPHGQHLQRPHFPYPTPGYNHHPHIHPGSHQRIPLRPGQALHPGPYPPLPGRYPGNFPLYTIGPGQHPYIPRDYPGPTKPSPPSVTASSPQIPFQRPQVPSNPTAFSPYYAPHLPPGPAPHPGSYQPLPGRYPGLYPIYPVVPGHHPYSHRDYPSTPRPELIPAMASPTQTSPPTTWLSELHPGPEDPKMPIAFPTRQPHLQTGPAPYPGHHIPLPGRYPGYYPFYPIQPGQHHYGPDYFDPPTPEPTPVPPSLPPTPSPAPQPSPGHQDPVVSTVYLPHPHLHLGLAPHPGSHQPVQEEYPGRYVIYPLGPGRQPYIPEIDPDQLTLVTPSPSQTLFPPHPTWLPSAPQEPTVPMVPPAAHAPQPVTCPPYAQTFCGYYPYSVLTPPPQPQDPNPFYGHHSFYQPCLHLPELQAEPSLRCLPEQMMVSLPTALPDSVQVKDEIQGWVSISSAPEACRYILQRRKGGGVILYSPFPACHSQASALDPNRLSFTLRIWDVVLGKYSTLKLQCPYTQSTLAPSLTTPLSSTTPISLMTHTRPLAPPRPKLLCSARYMSVELPPGTLSGIAIRDIKGSKMSLNDAPKHCGYEASRGKDGTITLTLPFSSCHLTVQGTEHRIDVIYSTEHGQTQEAHLSCPVSIAGSSEECNLPLEHRLPCGSDHKTEEECLSLGCCYSSRSPGCYYPMDECTADRHFVFLVPASITSPPLSPNLLATTGSPSCTPERVTSDYALFKIPLEGCGAHRYEVGESVIYMVEIVKGVQTISLHYGTITRETPLRLLVECRYTPGSVVSVGYMVKSPTLGPSIQAHGVFGVQLRIAKDGEYTSYYPQYHRPLQMLLGKPLYLEPGYFFTTGVQTPWTQSLSQHFQHLITPRARHAGSQSLPSSSFPRGRRRWTTTKKSTSCVPRRCARRRTVRVPKDAWARDEKRQRPILLEE
ncbi:hypothetical protein UPYG_G00064650 [Umbra pygmaea]|uniref:ZP domain-containing protein n=1 Tax=Umbra pygmaea TaxID=75934 RepID=A0ABD0XDF3_UMBPY